MSIWCCIICEGEVVLCSNLLSAEDAWNLGLVSFGAEVWTFYPSDTPSRALPKPLEAAGMRLLHLTRAGFECPDWDLIGLGATRWKKKKKIHLTSSDLLEG